MKNKLYIFYFLFLLHSSLFAEEVSIQSKNISLDKKNEVSIFEGEVIIVTESKNILKSDYAEYNKRNGLIKLKGNISLIDNKKNVIEADEAEYDKNKKHFKSIGLTKLTTNEKYIVSGKNINFNDNKKIINSSEETNILDEDKNNIFLDNFEFQINDNIFKSLGRIKVEDAKKNTYEFSQIYINTLTKEIIGTDIKASLNQENFKINQKNKPRIYANSAKLDKEVSFFDKSIFTLCNFRPNDKCPPWSIQASKMLHNSKKKTIYYNNAVIKVYDIPIFYAPKLSHPDPTVERRSGFLPPTIYDTKNLGTGISIPYFFNISKDKNFTLTSRFYARENSLFLGEYQQAFKNSTLTTDFGYTEGYRNTSDTKKAGSKSHFFSSFIKNFTSDKGFKSTLSFQTQDVSNDKYLKLYKIKSDLVDYNSSTLENSLSFTTENNDMFFGVNASIYETLKDSYNDKYEYIMPNLTFDKNLFNNQYGNLDLQTNFKVQNYDTNKLKSFFINDLNWISNNISFDSGLQGKFLANLKNINYEAKNIEIYKEDVTHELRGALGYLSEVFLQKESNSGKHFFTPKILFRYSPGNMRKETDGVRLDPINAYNLNRLEELDNYESGLSSTIGFDYKKETNNRNFDFSVAQIINDRENKKMSSKTSLDEKVSDLVGTMSYQLTDKIDLKYDFALDQNYSDFNYNELGTILNLDPVSINFNYLTENKHLGDQEYFTTNIKYLRGNDDILSFETKRNLITNSSEFYNLSYEYVNDCLRAGLVYRREFYDDSEVESENSLMFKITLTPFGNIASPSFSK